MAGEPENQYEWHESYRAVGSEFQFDGRTVSGRTGSVSAVNESQTLSKIGL